MDPKSRLLHQIKQNKTKTTKKVNPCGRHPISVFDCLHSILKSSMIFTLRFNAGMLAFYLFIFLPSQRGKRKYSRWLWPHPATGLQHPVWAENHCHGQSQRCPFVRAGGEAERERKCTSKCEWQRGEWPDGREVSSGKIKEKRKEPYPYGERLCSVKSFGTCIHTLI